MYLVIPAKNESQRIAKTLNDYLNYFSDWHFVVVISNCTDNTLEIVKEIKNKYPQRVDYILGKTLPGNSKGMAVREGWQYIFTNYQTEWLGFIDADNSIRPAEMEKLWRAKSNFDVIISSRYLPNSDLRDRNSMMRKIAGYVYRKFVKLFFQLPVVDTQCGAKIYKTEAIKKIYPFLHINDMVFDVEVLYFLKLFNNKIKEIPIVWIENNKSTITGSKFIFFKTSILMFFSLLKLRSRIFFNF